MNFCDRLEETIVATIGFLKTQKKILKNIIKITFPNWPFSLLGAPGEEPSDHHASLCLKAWVILCQIKFLLNFCRTFSETIVATIGFLKTQKKIQKNIIRIASSILWTSLDGECLDGSPHRHRGSFEIKRWFISLIIFFKEI